MENAESIVKKYKLSLKKNLGQNFLKNTDVIEDIVTASGVCEEDVVLEIGPGAGSMTELLADEAAYVICIEIDERLIPILEGTVGRRENVRVVNADALKCNFAELLEEYLPVDCEYTNIKMVANLPYYITTPLVMKILEEGDMISSMTLMMQKEVADRMCAEPGGKDFGAITLAVQYYSQPRKMFDVGPENFFPAPEVTSTVLKFDRHDEHPVHPKNPDYMFKVIKASFAQRRKTLLNGLSNAPYIGKSKAEIREAMAAVGVEENIRGERLSLQQFSDLADCLLSD